MQLLRKDKAIRYMQMALTQAQQFSKDQSTKVGALIIGLDTHEIRSTGYNGMPRGCNDSAPERQNRPEKYLWYEHAERNAIYNAARVGTPLANSLLIVTLFPCMDCARAVVQSGVRGVITMEVALDRWRSHFEKSRELFNECGVQVETLSVQDLILAAPAGAELFFKKALELGQ